MSWKMGIYRIVCLLLLLPVLLGGCGASSSLVRYDISGDVESLDPQFADEENEQLVIYNIMEGLMCQLPSGELTNGVIEGYDVSADQLTYTFHLRDGMVWDDADSTPVTAHDFVFAFQRIFNSIYPPPSPRCTAPSGTASRCSPASCRQASLACRPPTTSPSSLP